jgi:hypothetical protein
MPGEQGCSAASRSTRVPKGPKSSSPLWRLNDEENKLKTNLFISTVFYWKHNNYTWNWYLSSTCKLKRMIQERPNQECSVYKWSIAFSLWNFQTAQRPTILKIMAINCNERCTNFFSFLVPLFQAHSHPPTDDHLISTMVFMIKRNIFHASRKRIDISSNRSCNRTVPSNASTFLISNKKSDSTRTLWKP